MNSFPEVDETQLESMDEEDWVDPFPEHSLDQLTTMLAAQLAKNAEVQRENKMFSRYYERTSALTVEETTDTNQQTQESRGRRRSRAAAVRMRGNAQPTDLNPAQKCEIAQRELDFAKAQFATEHDAMQQSIAHDKAVIAELDLRSVEVARGSYEFNRDIVVGAVSEANGKVLGEKIEQYYESRIQELESIIEKLQLKNSAARTQRKKVASQLKQKQENGEDLHEVDFDHLKIENRQYADKIDERTKDLQRMKQSSTNALQMLDSCKKELGTGELDTNRLAQEITSRKQLLSKLDDELVRVRAECQRAQGTVSESKARLNLFRAPPVLDYVKDSATLRDLRKDVKAWQHKVALVEMDMKQKKQKWNAIYREDASSASSFRP